MEEEGMTAEGAKLNSGDYADFASRLGLLLAHFVQTAPGRDMIAPFEITVVGADDELILICDADATGVTSSSNPVNGATLDAKYPLTATFTDSRGLGVEWTITGRMTEVQ